MPVFGAAQEPCVCRRFASESFSFQSAMPGLDPGIHAEASPAQRFHRRSGTSRPHGPPDQCSGDGSENGVTVAWHSSGAKTRRDNGSSLRAPQRWREASGLRCRPGLLRRLRFSQRRWAKTRRETANLFPPQAGGGNEIGRESCLITPPRGRDRRVQAIAAPGRWSARRRIVRRRPTAWRCALRRCGWRAHPTPSPP